MLKNRVCWQAIKKISIFVADCCASGIETSRRFSGKYFFVAAKVALDLMGGLISYGIWGFFIEQKKGKPAIP